MMVPFPESIRVVFNEYRPHVSYAASLAAELNVPMTVYAPVAETIVSMAGKLLSQSPRDLDQEMIRAVTQATQRYFRGPKGVCVLTILADIVAKPFPENTLLVSCDTERYRGLHVLSPAGERQVFRAEKGPILIPVGDGDSSIFAATQGIALARRLSTEAIFWHTTWKNPEEPSSEPRKHVCPAAEKVITEVERMGRAGRVTRGACRVECAPTVVESIIRVALRSGASLIVMTRGKRKTYGAYVERVRARNCPVPLLILSQGAV